MSDDSNPAGEGQTADPADNAGETQSGSRDSGGDATAAELRRTRKALKEAQQKLDAAAQAAADKAAAEMSELDRYKASEAKLKRDLEETQKRATESAKRNAFKFALLQQDKKPVDVDAVMALADLSSLEVDGDTVSGADAAVKAFMKSRPALFGASVPAPAPSGGGGNPGSGVPKDLTLTKLRSTSNADFRQQIRDKAAGKR